MGFDRARHAALAEPLNELLNSQFQETSPTPQTNTATTSTIVSLEEKSISYLQDFSVERVLLSIALRRQKVLPDIALSMVSIGEKTGEMDQVLSKVADFYEDEVSA